MNYPHRRKETYKGIKIDKRGMTEAEVAAKIQKAKDDIDNGLMLKHGTTPVNIWWEQYRDQHIDKKVSYTTYKDRCRIYNKNIRPYLGTMRIQDVRPSHCQDALNAMSGHSRDYINKTRQLMYNLFQKAKYEKMIPDNPAEDLSSPAAVDGHGRPCTMQERALMLMALEDCPRTMWVKCILYLGMRPGETGRLHGGNPGSSPGRITRRKRGAKASLFLLVK